MINVSEKELFFDVLFLEACYSSSIYLSIYDRFDYNKKKKRKNNENETYESLSLIMILITV